jgi:hypothetical protein
MILTPTRRRERDFSMDYRRSYKLT